jgi:hypothetical protein
MDVCARTLNALPATLIAAANRSTCLDSACRHVREDTGIRVVFIKINGFDASIVTVSPERFDWERSRCEADFCARRGVRRAHILYGSVSAEQRSFAQKDQATTTDPIESFRVSKASNSGWRIGFCAQSVGFNSERSPQLLKKEHAATERHNNWLCGSIYQMPGD